MTPREIDVAEARAFWAHVSQLEPDQTPDMLPAEGVTYIACGPICVAFRQAPYPGVFAADFGVKPEGWGELVEPGRKVLAHFWARYRPASVIGFQDSRKRAAIAFARRCGCSQTLIADGTITFNEWRP